MDTNNNSTTASQASTPSDAKQLEADPTIMPPTGTTNPTSSDDLTSDASLHDFESRLLAWEVKRHGTIYERHAEHGIIFNWFTAAYFFIDLLNLRHSRRDNFFTSCDPAGQIHPIPISSMAEPIGAWLFRQAAMAGVKTPQGGNAKSVIRLIKTIIHARLSSEVFAHVCDRLEVKEGSIVTMSELLQDYQQFCDARGAAKGSPRLFYSDVTFAIERQLGIQKRRNIRRPGCDGTVMTKTGFCNVALSAMPYETRPFPDNSFPIPRPVIAGNPWTYFQNNRLHS